MPLLVTCSELEPGMVLLEPFLQSGRVMLTAGIELQAQEIAALKNRYPNVKVRVRTELDKNTNFSDDSFEREITDKVQNTVAKSIDEVQSRFLKKGKLSPQGIQKVKDTVNDVIEFIKYNPITAILLSNVTSTDDYISQRTGTVFFLSMMIGTHAKQYVVQERHRQSNARNMSALIAEDLTPLGLGSMLIDLGMIPYAEIYAQQDQNLSREIWREIRNHPKAGADMLPPNFPPAARAIVRTHHENMDGSGYPDRIPGERQHIFTRIVRLADSFEAATATRAYKEAKTPIRALWEVSRGPFRRMYDQTLVRVLCHIIQPFPIGTRILLENGMQGVVVSYDVEKPLSPKIVLAFDTKGRPVAPTDMQGPYALGEKPELRAVRCDGEDLSFMYDENNSDPAPSPELIRNTLFESAYP